jgi:hypothetical protein
MIKASITSPRADGKRGAINVTVEPSPKVQGIFVFANTHFPVKSEGDQWKQIIEFLSSDYETACAEARRVASTIFERIKPDAN